MLLLGLLEVIKAPSTHYLPFAQNPFNDLQFLSLPLPIDNQINFLKHSLIITFKTFNWLPFFNLNFY